MRVEKYMGNIYKILNQTAQENIGLLKKMYFTQNKPTP